jgi:hypothetical protein
MLAESPRLAHPFGFQLFPSLLTSWYSTCSPCAGRRTSSSPYAAPPTRRPHSCTCAALRRTPSPFALSLQKSRLRSWRNVPGYSQARQPAAVPHRRRHLHPSALVRTGYRQPPALCTADLQIRGRRFVFLLAPLVADTNVNLIRRYCCPVAGSNQCQILNSRRRLHEHTVYEPTALHFPKLWFAQMLYNG